MMLRVMLLLAMGLAPIPADGATAVTNLGESFVDVNLDGDFTPDVDLRLADVVDETDSEVLLLGLEGVDPLDVVFVGNVRVKGRSLRVRADQIEVRGRITTQSLRRGDCCEDVNLWADESLILDARSRITAAGLVLLYGEERLEVGDRVRLTTGVGAYIALQSRDILSLGERVYLRALHTGDGANIIMLSDGTIEIGPRLKVRGGGYADLEIASDVGDIVFDRFNFRADAMYVRAPGRIVVRRSFLAGNKSFQAGWVALRSGLGVEIERSKFNDIECLFRPSLSHVRGCREIY